MCGLVAFICTDGGQINEAGEEGMRRACAAMRKRGPDGDGLYMATDRRAMLGHRRLAIIDLDERAAQPMLWPERELVITYNGEIYNYLELRDELEKRGHRFRTSSDTEVILHGYGEWGSSVVTRLRGMFAFVIWDNARKEAFATRDPYGIKPLYYAWDGRTLKVASQVKALLEVQGIDTAPDAAGWVGFLLYGSVPEPWTTYQGIKALPSGATMKVVRGGGQEIRSYAKLSDAIGVDAPELTAEELAGEAREALRDSVHAHLVSDVPVGAFLSAGVDSGALVGLMRDAGYSDICTITLGFEEFRGTSADEVPLAEATARRYETRHHTKIITRGEFLDDWPRIFAAMDQPSIDGLNTWLVSKAAKEAGLKVVLSGIGGDELFGGYSDFQDIPRWVRRTRQMAVTPGARHCGYWLARGLVRASKRIPAKLPAVFRYGNSFEGAYFARRGLFMPWELPRLVGRDFAEVGFTNLDPVAYAASTGVGDLPTDFAKVSTLESALFLRNQLLRDSDWASMDHSLELRTPLVDWWLLCKLGPLLASRETPNKAPLAEAPLVQLSPDHQQRLKTGFGLPTADWLRDWMPKSCRSAGGFSRAFAANTAVSALAGIVQ